MSILRKTSTISCNSCAVCNLDRRNYWSMSVQERTQGKNSLTNTSNIITDPAVRDEWVSQTSEKMHAWGGISYGQLWTQWRSCLRNKNLSLLRINTYAWLPMFNERSLIWHPNRQLPQEHPAHSCWSTSGRFENTHSRWPRITYAVLTFSKMTATKLSLSCIEIMKSFIV